jgi:Fe-S-cluster containining protein
MDKILNNLPQLAKDKQKEHKRFFKQLRRRPPRDLDRLMQELHNDEFERTDCLKCANCCKTTGPLFTDRDIERLAKTFKIKPGEFIETYLRLDEEGDYVLNELPCPFLGADNYCSVYEDRPKACREFPHTDRRKFHQIAHLTIKNVAICPAAYNIVDEMQRRLQS